MDVYKAFVYMFYVLDAAYDKEPNEVLGNYLSGLNPFLFNDEGSADPAEYEQFRTVYKDFFKETNPEVDNIYNFCKSYLSEYAPPGTVKAFEQVKKEEWVEAFGNDKNYK